METTGFIEPTTERCIEPPCFYFGTCGGCAYQHFIYEDELKLKEENLKKLFYESLNLPRKIFSPIVPSPDPYHYRSRLDLSFRRHRDETQLGFMVEGTRQHININSCSIARKEISDFLPLLKQIATERLPENYKSANIVVKTGTDGRVRWGGIGRKSLKLRESDYLWTEIEGRKVFYSLDTFFQANLEILPLLIQKLRTLLELTPQTCLLDLYAGVGLFWVAFAREVKEVWAVEENRSAVRLAEFNRHHHGFGNVFLKDEKTEDCLDEILDLTDGVPKAAIVDPPRKGLSPTAVEKLVRSKDIGRLVYVSCHPPALVRDLSAFLEAGWQIDSVTPMDLFPRTRHLEVLTSLRP